MYEEGNRRLSLNWGSIIIKIVILVAIIFLAGWIFTRVTKNNNKPKPLAANTEYITNITSMKEAALEYFTKSKLPEKVGGTEKLTLSQMLNQKLLIDFTEDGKTCDINESYVQATKTADGNYALKVSLTCGDKSDFIITSIDAKEKSNNTTNTDVVVEPSKNQTSSNSNSSSNSSSNSTNKTSSSSSSSSSNSSSSTKKYSSSSSSSSTNKKVTSTTRPITTTVTTTVKVSVSCGVNCSSNNNSSNNIVKPTPSEKTRYYKYVKWSDWEEGCTTAKNAEVKKVTLTTYDYCKYNQKTYYSTGYVTDGTKLNSTYNYELQFLDINPLDVVNSKIEILNSTKSHFVSDADYQAYINSRGKELYMTGNTGKGNAEIDSVESFRNSSLKQANFNFGVSSIYYSGDIYRTKVTVNYYNKDGVTPYYSTRLNKNVYYVPLKFDVRYADANQCTRDLDTNSYKYTNHVAVDKQTRSACMYRVPEYKWSTEKSLSGYEYTGEYQDR